MTKTIVDLFPEIEKLPGWTTFPQAVFMSYFFQKLNNLSIEGDLLEIGVYHGRSALVIVQYLNDRRFHLVDHHFNEDIQKDLGNRFQNILEEKDILERIIFDRRCSFELRKDVAIQRKGEFAGIHIDGGHSDVDLIRDLEIADQLLGRKGVVICDDFFNFARPNVSEGILRFLKDHPHRFRLLVCGHHKAVLIRTDAHTEWFVAIMKDLVDYMSELWRPTMLHMFSSPIENPVLGLYDRGKNDPQYGGFFKKFWCGKLIEVLEKARDQ